MINSVGIKPLLIFQSCGREPKHALSPVMTSVPGVWPAHPAGWAGLTVKEPTMNIDIQRTNIRI